MEAKWLSVQSFFRNQRLISAINTLCIPWRDTARLRRSRATRCYRRRRAWPRRDFLSEFDLQVANYERSRLQVLPGVDPRQFELVKRFVSAKRRKDFSSATFKEKPGRVIEMLDAEDTDNLQPLVDALTELRILLEEHNQADVQNLVPEI